ncbi:MAG TPA: hypothetical protein VFP89_14140 [Propionibacteriaceae bacterium]|nr:hypothetical protein [Propionibacteriaceae bacterium]
MAHSNDAEPFIILAVCTGNICRSPAAERLLASMLDSSVSVASAGTYAMKGDPISPPMDRLIEQAGGSAAGFAATQLSERVIRPAGLVLGMTRAHRGAAVELWPASVRHAFTLRQFARLISQVDPSELPSGSAAERLRAAIPLAAANRGRQKASAQDDDVPDPYRRGDRAYAEAFAEIRAAVDAIGQIICIAPHNQGQPVTAL